MVPDANDQGGGDDDPPALLVRGLTVAYGATMALMDVDFTVARRTMYGVVGPNGAGKSTLLHACMDLAPRIKGQATFFGAGLKAARKRIAYMPQRMSVDWSFPARAIDVVLMGRYGHRGWLRVASRADWDAALACLARVDLATLAKRQIGKLSGGQRQRVFLARALAQEADLFLLDEPFAGIDAGSSHIIMHELLALRDAGRSIVCVHHDLAGARACFDTVLLLNKHKIAEGPALQALADEHIAIAYGAQFAGAGPAQRVQA